MTEETVNAAPEAELKGVDPRPELAASNSDQAEVREAGEIDPDALEDIARICHEVNRAYSEGLGQIGVPWEALSEGRRAMVAAGVLFVLQNPDVDVSALHEHWRGDMERAGWVYGPYKVEELKQHPNLVPFHQLSPNEQAKDRIFHGLVRAIARHVG